MSTWNVKSGHININIVNRFSFGFPFSGGTIYDLYSNWNLNKILCKEKTIPIVVPIHIFICNKLFYIY